MDPAAASAVSVASAAGPRDAGGNATFARLLDGPEAQGEVSMKRTGRRLGMEGRGINVGRVVELEAGEVISPVCSCRCSRSVSSLSPSLPSGQGKLHTSFLVGPPVEALVSPDTFATAKESAHERNAAGVLRRPLMAWLETLAFPLERNAAQAWHVGGSERGDLPPLKGAGRPCCRRWCSACGGEC